MHIGELVTDRYRILGEIAKGGGGRVWEARDERLDRAVAVKFQNPAEDGNEDSYAERIKRFTREAEINARIIHPCVPVIFDSGNHKGLSFIVMEYIHGMTLRDFIAENRPVHIATAVAITAQVCSALGAIHALGVVHRDLKPLNIMITEHGIVKLLDLGVAAVLDADSARLTTAGRQLGTEAYMSPEQINGEPVDPRADIYALGCLLYELLVGERVFSEVTGMPLQYKHVNAEPDSPRHRRPEIDEQLNQLILAMLAKNPDARPRNIEEVYDRLVPYRPGPADQVPAPQSTPDPTLPFRRPFAPALPSQRRPATSPSTRGRATRRRGDFPGRDKAKAVRREALHLSQNGQHQQAADLLTAVLTRISPALGERDPLVLDIRADCADALLAAQQSDAALAEYQRLIVDHGAIFGAGSAAVQRAAEGAVDARIALGDLQNALADVHATLTDREENIGVHCPELFGLRLRECQILTLLPDRKRAELALDLLLSDTTTQFGPDSIQAVQVQQLMRGPQ